MTGYGSVGTADPGLRKARTWRGGARIPGEGATPPGACAIFPSVNDREWQGFTLGRAVRTPHQGKFSRRPRNIFGIFFEIFQRIFFRDIFLRGKSGNLFSVVKIAK